MFNKEKTLENIMTFNIITFKKTQNTIGNHLLPTFTQGTCKYLHTTSARVEVFPNKNWRENIPHNITVLSSVS